MPAERPGRNVEEYGPYLMYLFNTLLPYGQVYQKDTKGYYSSTAFEHLRQGAKGTLAEDATIFNAWTMDTVRTAAEHMPIGAADETVERIGREVLPKLQAHNVLRVPHAESNGSP